MLSTGGGHQRRFRRQPSLGIGESPWQIISKRNVIVFEKSEPLKGSSRLSLQATDDQPCIAVLAALGGQFLQNAHGRGINQGHMAHSQNQYVWPMIQLPECGRDSGRCTKEQRPAKLNDPHTIGHNWRSDRRHGLLNF